MSRFPVLLALALVGLLSGTSVWAGDGSDGQPNVVFFLMDDLGWGDPGSYGNTYHRTPHIDALAAAGMRFTAAYAAAPNCSPTRSSILTGQWPARTGITQYLPGNRGYFRKQGKPLLQPELPAGLPREVTTLAEALRDAGYATGMMGKWHLGGGPHRPGHHGFETTVGVGIHNHDSMFAPFGIGAIPGTKKGDYLTDRLAAQACRFIEAHRDEPFFLYLPFFSVHAPVDGKSKLVEAYQRRPKQDGHGHAKYAAMLEGADQAIGRVMDRLSQLGLTEDTIVIFFSDNGAVPRRGFNGPYRKGKGHLYEGGIRVPLIVRWPGHVEAGAVSDVPVSSVDFLPTLTEIAGASVPSRQAVDGADLSPVLTGEGSLPREALYWHYPHYSWAGAAPGGAIRRDGWKLLEFFEDDRVELYNLERDPGETRDLAEERPQRATRLREALHAWRERVDAKMPSPNPDAE